MLWIQSIASLPSQFLKRKQNVLTVAVILMICVTAGDVAGSLNDLVVNHPQTLQDCASPFRVTQQNEIGLVRYM